MNAKEPNQLDSLSIQELIELFGPSHYTTRLEICEQLRRRGPIALDITIAGLNHENAQMRKSCADLLDELGDDRAIEPLMNATNDPVAAVRQSALHALSCDRCKSKPLDIDMVPMLTQLALYDPSVKVRTHAVIALRTQSQSSLSETEMIALLTQLALHDPSIKVRQQAVGSLGFYPPASHLVPVMENVINELITKPKLSKRERGLLFAARWTRRHHARAEANAGSRSIF